MNYILQNEIIKHILFNLGIPQNSTARETLINQKFLLEKFIQIQSEDQTLNNRLWGCDIVINQQVLKLLLADCSQNLAQEYLSQEYCLIIHFDNCPIYGLYFSFDQNETDNYKSYVAYKDINSNQWIKCSIFLQATLLAGMEQIKDFLFSCKKCPKYEVEYQALISFINYYVDYYFDGENSEE